MPLAAGILAPVGFVLPDVGRGDPDVAVDIVVALNAQLRRRLDLNPEKAAAH